MATGGTDRIAALDRLAEAKQSLSVHPRLAKVQIDEFRAVWDLPVE